MGLGQNLTWYTTIMSNLRPHNILRGFTLIEILVVVAIVSALAMVGVANFSDTSATARDAQRQADLKNLQNAIETYRSQNGRYPYQATSTGAGSNGWSGELGTIYRPDNGTGQYIVGLAPEYISVLPTDPRLNGTDSGYVYRTNAEGTVYKLKALKTVESEVVTFLHPLKPCDVRVEQSPGGLPSTVTSRDPRIIGWCGAISVGGTSAITPPLVSCRTAEAVFNTSYAVWGGLAPLYDGAVGPGNPFGIDPYAADPLEVIALPVAQQNRKRLGAIQDTTDVICQ